MPGDSTATIAIAACATGAGLHILRDLNPAIMTHHRFVPFILISLLLLTRPATAQSADTAAARVDSLFASYDSRTPGAAIAIIKDGKVVFQKGYGMADLDHGIPITPQTAFNAASVSKQFTAFAIYLLESEGKLSFDDPISRWFPELPDWARTVKVRQLLGHTSGVRDQWALLNLAGWRMDDVITTRQVMKLLSAQRGLNFTPGTMFGYNNAGYTLLAEIVARVSGQSFSAFTTERIFRPLGMTNTWFQEDHEQVVRNRAESYEKVGDTWHHKALSVSNAGPSNLYTTVEDLTKWVLNFERPVVGDTRLIAAFNEPSRFNDGTKVVNRVIAGDTIFHAKGQMLSHHKGAALVSHGGHTAAYRTFLGRFPEQRFAVIMLSNDEHNERLPVRWQLADYYIGDALREEPATAPAPRRADANPAPTFREDLATFTGRYSSDELETRYTFKVVDGALVMSHTRLSDVTLRRTGERTFTGSGTEVIPLEAEFQKDPKGKVTGLLISNFGVKQLRFTRT